MFFINRIRNKIWYFFAKQINKIVCENIKKKFLKRVFILLREPYGLAVLDMYLSQKILKPLD